MKKIIYISCCIFVTLFNQAFAQEKVGLSGYVKDAESGEGLIGATVYVEPLKIGVATNIYGYYSIELPPGTYTVSISYLGFSPLKKEMNIQSSQTIDIELKPITQDLETLTITGEKLDKNVQNTEMGVVKLDIKSIKQMPSLLGENDVLRTVQLLPGVQSGGEANTGFFVRGGNSDQNLILLDDAPVYNPAHLFGIFSVFNPDAIKDLKIYKGGIPAKYGGRLSSLLDIKMKEGNSKRLTGAASISPISSKLTLEAPLIKDKSSFIISARRSYADLFLKLSPDTNVRNNKLYFYDFNAKLNYTLNDNNRIFLSGYFGKDLLSVAKDFGTQWGNQTGTVRWSHIFNSKLFLSTTFYASLYSYQLKINDNIENIKYDSRINNYGAKGDFTYYLNPSNTIQFGINSIQYSIQPGKFRGDKIQPLIIPSNNAWEHAAYLSNKQDLSKKIALEYGLRFSAFQNVGKATLFHYDRSNPLVYKVRDSSNYAKGNVFNTYTNFEPRISTRYKLNEWSSIKASYNRTSQYIHQANNATAASPLTVWMPSSPNIKPQLADQYAVGYFRNFFENVLETSVEVYYKDMRNTVDFRDNAELLLNKHLDGEVRIGKSYSYGVELLFRKSRGKLTGWVGYTWSRTKRKIPEINNGKAFFAPYDRTHDLSIVAMYQLNKKVSVSTNWVYTTGTAVSVPTGKFNFQGSEVSVYSDRNSARVPDYHRWDVSITFKGATLEEKERIANGGKYWKYTSEWSFSLLNVYNRRNAYTINFRQNEDTGKTEAIKTYFFPILPSVTYNIKF